MDKKIIKLTESDLARIVKRVISEQPTTGQAQGSSVPNKPISGRPTTGQTQGSGRPTTGQTQGSGASSTKPPLRDCKLGDKGILLSQRNRLVLTNDSKIAFCKIQTNGSGGYSQPQNP